MIVGLLCLFVALFGVFYTIIPTFLGRIQQQRDQFSKRLAADFLALHIFVDGRSVVTIYWSVGVIVVLLLCLVDLAALGLGLSILLTIAPKHSIRWAKCRRLTHFDEQLLDCLLQIAGALKAGSSFLKALELLSNNSSGPAAQEFGVVVQEYRMGTTIDQALHNLEHRVPSDNLSLAVSIAAIAGETGGNLAESLERLADSIREKIKIEKKIKALTSQGKMQGIVVGLLPLAIGLVIGQIEGEAMTMILTSWLGYGTIMTIAILEGLGLYSIAKIVAIDV